MDCSISWVRLMRSICTGSCRASCSLLKSEMQEPKKAGFTMTDAQCCFALKRLYELWLDQNGITAEVIVTRKDEEPVTASKEIKE